jgi:hypothetical protein
MNISRREILRAYFFVNVGRGPIQAMVLRSDADLACSAKWTLARRMDGKVVAREAGGKRRYLHLLVAERHHGPRPSPDHVCEHLNGDLLDCRPDNLKWSLRGETEFHRSRSVAVS